MGFEVRVGEIESLAARPASHRAVVSIVLQCAGQELNLHCQRRVGYSHLGSPMPSRRILFQWHGWELNPQTITKV